MSNPIGRRLACGLLAGAALGVTLGVGLASRPAPALAGLASGQALMWTADVQHWYAGSWDNGMAAAAAHVEGGFDDWRLPTEAELQAALQDGSWGQDASSLGGTFRHWTSRAHGIWAWAVTVKLDANGSPIPSQSGASKKYLKTSNFYGSKFVRP